MRKLPPEWEHHNRQPPAGPDIGTGLLPLFLVFLLLLGGTLWLSLRMSAYSERTPVSYSTFLEHIENDRVEGVTIDELRVHGLLQQEAGSDIAPVVDDRVADGAVANTGQHVRDVSFETRILPADLPYLIDMLHRHDVTMEVAEPGGWSFGNALMLGLPVILIGGLLLYRFRPAWRADDVGPNATNPVADVPARVSIARRPRVRLSDVAGEEQAKAELAQVVDFLRFPGKYHAVGARLPRGVLLAGPPGTGKTMLAKAVAGEARVPFFNMSASEFVEMYAGLGAGRVRGLFQHAKRDAPAVIFIDELDAVGRRRGAGEGSGNEERDQTLNQLLVEMDGFERHQSIVVLAATNRPDILDPALLRPGRFDRQVVMQLPDRHAREQILHVHCRKVRMASDIDLHSVAALTPGMSGADLANLVNEAALMAAREHRVQVEQCDLEHVLDKVTIGLTRSTVPSRAERQLAAYHEAGHALVAHHIPGSDPVRKVTILPRGSSFGTTVQAPNEDRYNATRGQLLAKLAVSLGGLASERLVFGEVSTRAGEDLKQATELATRMIGVWGMCVEVGPVFLGDELTGPLLRGERLLRCADQALVQLIDASLERVDVLLHQHRMQLDRLANALLEEETVEAARIAEVLAGECPCIDRDLQHAAD